MVCDVRRKPFTSDETRQMLREMPYNFVRRSDFSGASTKVTPNDVPGDKDETGDCPIHADRGQHRAAG